MTGDVAQVGEYDDVVDATFDESTHTWTVRTSTGTRRARIVIATNGFLPASGVADHVELAPYLGVAAHGVPNYFVLSGPERARQKRYIIECLEYMRRTGSTRIEVRYSTQRVFKECATQPNWRRMRDKIGSAFEFDSLTGLHDEVYDGPATVAIGENTTVNRVRLTGRVDPIDGRYHWQGTILGPLTEVTRMPQPVTLTIDGHSAQARVTERTQQGGYSVVGLGAPPYARTAMVSTATATTPPANPEISSGS